MFGGMYAILLIIAVLIICCVYSLILLVKKSIEKLRIRRGASSCQSCGDALNSKSYKGFNEILDYEGKPSAEKTTSEGKQISEKTQIRSNVTRYADFEKSIQDQPEVTEAEKQAIHQIYQIMSIINHQKKAVSEERHRSTKENDENE